MPALPSVELREVGRCGVSKPFEHLRSFPCVWTRQSLNLWLNNGELVIEIATPSNAASSGREVEEYQVELAQDQVDALIVYLVGIRSEVDDQTKGLREACELADVIVERNALRAELAALKAEGAV